MNNLEVQKRVLSNGKPIALNDFTWCEKTKTFTSVLDRLVFDFNYIDNCTFDTGSSCTFDTGDSCTFNTGSDCMFKTSTYCTLNTGYGCTFNTGYSCTFKTSYRCTFKTGSDCTFNTGYGCTFDTGSSCTFDTGSSCTFKTGDKCTFKTSYSCTFKVGHNCTFKVGEMCVIVRRDIHEVIQPKENTTIKLCPYGIKGYISKEKGQNCFYKDGVEYIIADGILSKVISKRNGIYKVLNNGDTKQSYLIDIDGVFSHGETLKEAKESFRFKVGSRDKSEYENLTKDTVLKLDDCIRAYRVITGACESGSRYFIENNEMKDEYTMEEFIEKTKGQFGNKEFSDFIGDK